MQLNKIKEQGLFNGTELATIDTIPIIKEIYQLYRNKTRNIATQYTRYKDSDRQHTNKFLGINKKLGTNTMVFKDLIDTGNGHSFRTKDPYNDNTLKGDFLKNHNSKFYKLFPKKIKKINDLYDSYFK